MIAKTTDGAKNLGDNGISTSLSELFKKIQNNSPILPPKIVTLNHLTHLYRIEHAEGVLQLNIEFMMSAQGSQALHLILF